VHDSAEKMLALPEHGRSIRPVLRALRRGELRHGVTPTDTR
jgi:hypothetical protein